MVLDFLCALLLFAVCIAAWALTARARSAVRINLRFAVLLFAALAVARALALAGPDFSALAPAVAVIAASLGSVALVLSLFAVLSRPLPALAATLALGLALGAGLAASLSAMPVYALGCQVLGVLPLLAAALGGLARRTGDCLVSLLAAAALLCGGLCLVDGAVNPALVFFAASLVAAARVSQPRVEAERKTHLFAGVTGRA